MDYCEKLYRVRAEVRVSVSCVQRVGVRGEKGGGERPKKTMIMTHAISVSAFVFIAASKAVYINNFPKIFSFLTPAF